jgi:hypothetical protein
MGTESVLMPRILRVALVGLAVPALVLAAGSTAQAERWSATDAAGDVTGWHYDPEPEPCGTQSEVDGSPDANDDISRLIVRHTRKVVRVTVGFRDLDPALDQSVDLHFQTTRPRGWAVDIDRLQWRPGKPFRVLTSFSRETRYPDPEDIETDPEGCGYLLIGGDSGSCRPMHAEVETDLDLVRIEIPRYCLRNPRWVQVGARSTGWTWPEDPADKTFTSFSDEWGVRDPMASRWLPPFGPRVGAPTDAQRAEPRAKVDAD